MIISPVSLVISRYADTSSNGYIGEVLTSSFGITAEVQPAKPNEIESLPENERGKDTLKLYVDSSSFSYIQKRDRFIYNGMEYRVVGIYDYTHHMIPHHKIMAVKIE